MGSANAQHPTRKRKACPSASLESVAPSRVLALRGVRAAGAVRLRQSKVARAEGKAWELRLGPAPSASKPAPQSQAPRGRLRALSRSEPPGIDTLDSSTLDLCLSLCRCLCLCLCLCLRRCRCLRRNLTRSIGRGRIRRCDRPGRSERGRSRRRRSGLRGGPVQSAGRRRRGRSGSWARAEPLHQHDRSNQQRQHAKPGQIAAPVDTGFGRRHGRGAAHRAVVRGPRWQRNRVLRLTAVQVAQHLVDHAHFEAPGRPARPVPTRAGARDARRRQGNRPCQRAHQDKCNCTPGVSAAAARTWRT